MADNKTNQSSAYYDFFRKHFLFRLPTETAHRVTLEFLQIAYRAGLSGLLYPAPLQRPLKVMGIDFPNPVGLGAGMDKNGDYIAALASLGFGFIEIGTVTPQPQTGNPAPRLFRLPQYQGIINRMGFNNKGCDYVVNKLQQSHYKGVLGVNIGKNAATPLDKAHEDYLHVFQRVAPFASYVTLNISSPNTQSLRDLQHGDLLSILLRTMKAAQQSFLTREKKYVPLVVKIAPDLSSEELQSLAKVVIAEGMDGIIATNTTLSRQGVENAEHAHEAGGLSGKPLSELATAQLAILHSLIGDQIPIIASGGICSGEDARQKIAAGARLIQLYSGLIYRGPILVREVVAAI
jgi:dihydroorotate dehydrogenase